MYQVPVGQFKSQFSGMLGKVLHGESVGITYGKNRKGVAALVPYKKYARLSKLKLGFLEGKATFTIHEGFKMTDEEFLHS